jgi:hypothetical protein
MARPAKHALTVLAAPELRVEKANLKQLQATAVEQVLAVGKMENNAAKGGILAGLTLLRVKASMKHGEFGPWLDKMTAAKTHNGANLPPVKERQLQYYMRLTLVFLEKTRLDAPDLLALPDGTTALDLGGAHKAKSFVGALDRFVGELSLNELLIKHDIKSVGLKTELTAGDDADEGSELTPAQKAAAEREAAWQAWWTSTQTLRTALTDPNEAQKITDPKKIETLKAEVTEINKLLDARLDALRAKKS